MSMDAKPPICEPPLLKRERALLHELTRLAAERARRETAVDTDCQSRKHALEQELQQTRQRLRTGFEADKTAVEREHLKVRQELTSRFEAEYAAVDKEYQTTRSQLIERHVVDKEEAEKEQQEAAWSVTTIYEAAKSRIDEDYKAVHKHADETLARIDAIQDEALHLLDEWNQDASFEKASVPSRRERDGLDRMRRRLADAENHLARLQELRIPRLFKGERLLGLCLLAYAGIEGLIAALLYMLARFEKVPVYPNGWPRDWYYWPAASTVIVGLAGLLLRWWLSRVARTQVAALYQPLRQALFEARALCKRTREEIEEATPRLRQESKQRHDKGLRRVDEKFCQKWAEIQQRHAAELHGVDERYPRRLAELKKRFEIEQRAVEEQYPRRLADIRQRYETEAQQFQQRYQRETADYQQQHDHAWQELVNTWRGGLARLETQVRETGAECERLFPAWSSAGWSNWKPPRVVPQGMRFGAVRVGLEQIPDGTPADERLRASLPGPFVLPALLPFPERGSLLLRVGDAGRAQAVRVLQALMLRFLTALPPGKVRFTIIDPVGLGENFASFMHLADIDEALVTSRIWTEPLHIEQRLADLTEHMEKVIQKYLRNQYPTLEAYNAQAGEVAEAYRILVVANFPANFTEAAARRLLSISQSGAGCGVYTLISVDVRQPLPPGIQLKDLEQDGVTLVWKDERFQWKDGDFGRFPLELDAPPDADFSTRVLQVVGTKARAAGRVEVPFEFIVPAAEAWWTHDSRLGIRVPLGRAGATKLQDLQLGQGTSQHVLIAGKTGSGKSTLLHALIVNLALHYSPDEVEFYLIDFKKGVEFKTYATHALPHARVVAIESEREFGLSVLQRLDAELKDRGERFRARGVHDVNGYRQSAGTPLPRILLIIDEFQEFFIEDDKIAQDVALLLDRLVRQGRAFGIHVLLGSQTLGGAYSLARSTLGQMAIRIALQCSEADAHLILSEENTAARLLSRPGEAIYNDANGLVEGNDFFQVVWLPDERKEVYLSRLHELAEQRRWPGKPQIVFEGNVPAVLAQNPRLTDAAATPGQALSAWLGEAIAIKDPTAAVFRPQSGSNLLIIGQQDVTGLALLASALVSLAVQCRAGALPAQFHVLDGTPVDAPHLDYLARLADALPASLFPGVADKKVAGPRETPAVLATLAGLLEHRQQHPDSETAPVFLLVLGLQRFRDLRRQEDDFGFSAADKPLSPAQHFATLLREGPALGLFTLAWCDSHNNVNRSLDRQGLRDFEMRVLMQMSASDSSVLIDSPVAGKLGPHRALFHTEERAQAEKFRPYALPDLDWVRQRFTT